MSFEDFDEIIMAAKNPNINLIPLLHKLTSKAKQEVIERYNFQCN